MDDIQLPSNSPQKKCTTCQKILPATIEYFYGDKNAKDGLTSSCKECRRAKRKLYYKKNTEKAKEYSKRYASEHQEHVAEYHKRYAEQHKADLAEYKKAYNAKHREEILAHHKQWYAEHRQLMREYWKQYRRNNAEKKRERDRKYRQENLERLKAQNREYKSKRIKELAAYSRKYYRMHVDEIRVYQKRYIQTERGIIVKRTRSHNRRARKKNAPGSHTTEQLYQLLQKQEGKCYYCEKKLPTGRNSWNADHYIPLSRGGSNDISNIVISCPACNRKKHDKLPNEWINRNKQ